MKHKGLFEECISRERAQAKVINELLTGSNNGPVSLQFITETGKHYWDKRNYIVWAILNTVEFGLVQKKCDLWSPVVRSLHRLRVKLRSQTCNSWLWAPAWSQTCSYAATLLRSSGSGWLLGALQDWWTHVYHICSMLPGIMIKVGTFQTLNHIKIGYFSYFINFKPVFIFFTVDFILHLIFNWFNFWIF